MCEAERGRGGGTEIGGRQTEGKGIGERTRHPSTAKEQRWCRGLRAATEGDEWTGQDPPGILRSAVELSHRLPQHSRARQLAPCGPKSRAQHLIRSGGAPACSACRLIRRVVQLVERADDTISRYWWKNGNLENATEKIPRKEASSFLYYKAL